jgi:hypothetical protein
MKCFYCIAEQVAGRGPLFGKDVKKAVTQYNGTAVCAIHAHRLLEREEKVAA